MPSSYILPAVIEKAGLFRRRGLCIMIQRLEHFGYVHLALQPEIRNTKEVIMKHLKDRLIKILAGRAIEYDSSSI
jgi:hypothetical protein